MNRTWKYTWNISYFTWYMLTKYIAFVAYNAYVIDWLQPRREADNFGIKDQWYLSVNVINNWYI